MSWNGTLSRELKTSGTVQMENAVTAIVVALVLVHRAEPSRHEQMLFLYHCWPGSMQEMALVTERPGSWERVVCLLYSAVSK